MEDIERIKQEREILRTEFARVDTERLRLAQECAELRALLAASAVPELQKQLREARQVLKAIVDRVVAPLANWRRGRQLIDAHKRVLDQAVIEIVQL